MPMLQGTTRSRTKTRYRSASSSRNSFSGRAIAHSLLIARSMPQPRTARNGAGPRGALGATSAARPIALRRGHHAIDERAAILHLDLHLIAGLQELAAVAAAGADARGRAGRDDIARPQGELVAQRRDLLGNAVNHVLRIRILLQHVIDPELD